MASMMPVMPPMVKVTKNEMANSIAVVNWTRPPQIVAIQLKTFRPVGTPITKVVSAKAVFTTGPKPVVNM